MRGWNPVQVALNRLNYDFQHFSVDHFVRHVETHTRREIILNRLSLDLRLSALWIRAETADYIFYNQNVHPVLQNHSILHELAHIVLKHPAHRVEDVLTPELVTQLHARPAKGRLRLAEPTHRQGVEEREAERFVVLIQRRVLEARRLEILKGPSTSNVALREWVDGMGFTERDV
ncbi:MAG: hypothetical protein AAFV33_02300 [Chloroflexota bacterium]